MVFRKSPPDYPVLSQRAISWAVHVLKLEGHVQGVRFFHPSDHAPGSDTKKIRFRGRMEGPKNMKGVALEFDPVIYVRGGMTPEETVITIGHEAYHKYEYENLFETSEERAEAFGRQLLYHLKYRLPRRGVGGTTIF